MKKFFLCAVIALFTSVAYAKVMPQYVITDCGTVHQIPSDATPDEACDWLDYWSSVDCN